MSQKVANDTLKILIICKISNTCLFVIPEIKLTSPPENITDDCERRVMVNGALSCFKCEECQ